MDPAYEAGALALNPGEISMPVESQFGFHLIQLIEKRGNEYNSRHILIMPKPSSDDTQKSHGFPRQYQVEIIEENMTFQEAAKEFSDDKNTSVNGGFIQGQYGSLRVPAAGLDPELFFTIDQMDEGDISNAAKVKMSADVEVARIIYYKNVSLHTERICLRTMKN